MFNTYKLNEQGLAQIKNFKNELAKTVMAVSEVIPEGREKALFLTKIEEAVFFGTNAIASYSGNYEDITSYPAI